MFLDFLHEETNEYSKNGENVNNSKNKASY